MVSKNKFKLYSYRLLFVFLAGFFLWHISIELINAGYIVDIAKRLESPDGKKLALLERRHSFVDLNFAIIIYDGHKAKEIYVSSDLDTNLSINWNENIKWSEDSSFLVLSLNKYGESRIWGYDFKTENWVLEAKKINQILKSRRKKSTE